MGLRGKLIAAIEYKAGGDVFHELLKHKPHELTKMSPNKLQVCDLHEGHEYGHVGTILNWTFIHDGKDKKAKQIIEVIDEDKKLIKLKTLEGDLLELYKTYDMTVHVENSGDIDMVTWTIEYEMRNEDVEEHPLSLLSFLIDLTNDIETHHLIAKP